MSSVHFWAKASGLLLKLKSWPAWPGSSGSFQPFTTAPVPPWFAAGSCSTLTPKVCPGSLIIGTNWTPGVSTSVVILQL